MLDRLIGPARERWRSRDRRNEERQASPDTIEPSAAPTTTPETAHLDEPEPLDPVLGAIVATFRQGDVSNIGCLPVQGRERVWTHPTPMGAVLLTQTCDAVRMDKLTVQLAPLISLSGNVAKDARDNKILRFVHVPSAGQDLFADLSIMATIDKARFVHSARTTGVDQADDDAVRRFGRALGRRLSRFAFPDEVVPWLRPLEKVILSKHSKQGPEGAAMRDIVELRIEAVEGWRSPPYSLVLCVITERGVMPSFPGDEIPPCPTDLDAWLRTTTGELRPTSSAIAEKLIAERERSPSSVSTYWLWLSLAEAWVARCIPDLGKFSPMEATAIRDAVEGIESEVVDEDRFTLYRYRRSEQLDLDHLSPPNPQ